MKTKLEVKKPRLTVAAVCRSMIIMGRTDGQIMAALRRKLNFDGSKRYYIAWYRWDVKRRGLVADRRMKRKPVVNDHRRSGHRYAA